MRDLREHLKCGGMFVIGLVVMAAGFVLCALFLWGMVWVSNIVLPWLLRASLIALVICVFVLLPLSLFRKTRAWAANGYLISSFVFGAMLLVYACIVAYQIWGYGGLIIGLFLAGIGVVPVAYVATIFHGQWWNLLDLVVGTFLTFGTRSFAIYLNSKSPASVEDEYE